MKYVSNLDNVLNQLDDRLRNVDVDKLTREQATTVLAMMRDRIHTDGKASDGNQIGTYSKAYISVRSGTFKNAPAKTVKPGKTSRKDYGSYTKGAKVGTKRIKYNRGTDSKVVLSLTRQMESDYVIIPVENGHGIGFSNADNFDKAKWNEERYKKSIFAMTSDEEDIALRIAERYIEELLGNG